FAVGTPASGELSALAASSEKADAFRTHLREELQRSRELLRARLGRAPRALACPYGRCSGMAQGLASELGFVFALSLEPELASTARPMAIGRYLPLNT
ncbi:polysaccharide deacetylase family protein, partial [Escherichia coli]|uniref:polysaccharide deacetylase family protein n=1 Tax=Escherichia coli TaxID=562 RepID=UPI002115814C